MYKTLLGAALMIGTLGLAGTASAQAVAIATTDVNLRAGPSTGYPAVDVVPSGDNVRVYGCLEQRSWCDVSYGGIRGWMSSDYLAYFDRGRRYTGPRVVASAPIVTFSVGNYWGRYYRGRSFYRDRDRWDRWGHDRGGYGDGHRGPDPRWRRHHGDDYRGPRY
ncbi:SH3 domain-containing protein [Mangrovibrevibacter kandeliae]|uniref:SH3 domain-containing protein n=1 Tax=Mangrovibrevibacter kandeliae TaxID=2968473 RepID=UPI002117AB49|nr:MULTISPECIES: SH3 domain-containing protein [unclassified Aurantimonas]MCQ8784298.1 SH3 domain-containing protein [Aurantimonas sp. CSK15Z-1]MCW4117054.1 SH3 domain-containing protein [Aurantimonas sp. MSK8Z-1]